MFHSSGFATSAGCTVVTLLTQILHVTLQALPAVSLPDYIDGFLNLNCRPEGPFAFMTILLLHARFDERFRYATRSNVSERPLSVRGSYTEPSVSRGRSFRDWCPTLGNARLPFPGVANQSYRLPAVLSSRYGFRNHENRLQQLLIFSHLQPLFILYPVGALPCVWPHG